MAAGCVFSSSSGFSRAAFLSADECRQIRLSKNTLGISSGVDRARLPSEPGAVVTVCPSPGRGLQSVPGCARSRIFYANPHAFSTFIVQVRPAVLPSASLSSLLSVVMEDPPCSPLWPRAASASAADGGPEGLFFDDLRSLWVGGHELRANAPHAQGSCFWGDKYLTSTGEYYDYCKSVWTYWQLAFWRTQR